MPDITVIIPAYNAETTVARTLEALLASSADPASFEVIVVDDGSTDGTVRVVERFVRSGGPRVRLLRRDRRNGFGPGITRNDGLGAAEGRVIAFTDADCVPDPDWLDSVARAVLREGNALVGGDTWCDEVLLFPWRVAPAGHLGITANLAFDRERLTDHCFDPAFNGFYGEDADFVFRAKARGFRSHHDPRMRVFHPAREERLAALCRRAMARSNEVLLLKRHGAQAARCMHPFFRPAVLGRVSVASLACWGAAAYAFFAVSLRSQAMLLAGIVCLGALIGAFLLIGYKACVTYRPPGAARVSFSERLRTLAMLAVYVPVFCAARVKGSLAHRALYL